MIHDTEAVRMAIGLDISRHLSMDASVDVLSTHTSTDTSVDIYTLLAVMVIARAKRKCWWCLHLLEVSIVLQTPFGCPLDATCRPFGGHWDALQGSKGTQNLMNH